MTIRIYVDPASPECQRAEEFLRGLGRTYVVRDIIHDRSARRDLLLIVGRTEVPVLTAGYQAAIGFDPENWLKVLAHGDEVARQDPFALPDELGPDPTRI